jgi:hypothetical protein
VIFGQMCDFPFVFDPGSATFYFYIRAPRNLVLDWAPRRQSGFASWTKSNTHFYRRCAHHYGTQLDQNPKADERGKQVLSLGISNFNRF